MSTQPVRCVKCGKLTLCKSFHEDAKSGERLGPFCPLCRPRVAENYVLGLHDPTQTCEITCEGCVYENPPKRKEILR